MVGEEASRYKSRDLAGQLAGPTAGTVTGILSAATNAGTGDLTKADLRKIRRVLPGQNHFLARALLDKIEDKTAQELGLPDQESRKTRQANLL